MISARPNDDTMFAPETGGVVLQTRSVPEKINDMLYLLLRYGIVIEKRPAPANANRNRWSALPDRLVDWWPAVPI